MSFKLETLEFYNALSQSVRKEVTLDQIRSWVLDGGTCPEALKKLASAHRTHGNSAALAIINMREIVEKKKIISEEDYDNYTAVTDSESEIRSEEFFRKNDKK